ncbi:MAG TPA: MMPL family transporter [Saprospiraceae bacterium]|nr:MMPL family transporter [Saprospiraceae bacterium]HMP23802.1 MMPL family transporter [Saprospiraceae bacterium]
MKIRIAVIVIFTILAAVSGFYLTKLKFSFDFEQFFPQGDEDLAYFREFVQQFETDDNFMLVAVRRQEGIFQQEFLEKFHDYTLKTRDLPHVVQSMSLTKFGYPVRTPFAITTVPAIHINNPERYQSDSLRIMQDERFKYNLISEDGKSLVVFLKMEEGVDLEQSKGFMRALNALTAQYDFEEFHYLGRPYFQKELVEMQIREVVKSAIISGLLVSLILFLIFRRFWGVFISLLSIGLGMLFFLGFMGAFGRELSAMAALYPVLMIIVGTSDVIHILSKYIDELRRGQPKGEAIAITIREIGLATLLTSITTAIGFTSLMANRVGPIKDFGINAAIGVMVAFITVIFFTTAVVSMFSADQISKIGKRHANWDTFMLWLHRFTRLQPNRIALGALAVVGLCAWGISMINTNYEIIDNMPRGEKISEDFRFFEQQISGFRPLEFAGYVQEGYTANDFTVVQEIDKMEQHLKKYADIQAVGSVAMVYKSIHQMYRGGNPDAWHLPETEEQFEQYRRIADKVPQAGMNVLVSKDETMARVTSRIRDIGADSIKSMSQQIDRWIAANINPEIIQFKMTGTGLLIDKNAEYIRTNLLVGLGIATLIIAGLMTLLFQDLRMMLVALIPNVFPLIIGGAFLGFTGVELEAGVSIVFSVIFGIAVDDTIHFLSKFKLARLKGKNVEDALQITFIEAGKPIVLTSVVLFFGFLVMLFSVHPPSQTVGWLISLTLLTAVACDLLLIPVLIRWLIKDKPTNKQVETAMQPISPAESVLP